MPDMKGAKAESVQILAPAKLNLALTVEFPPLPSPFVRNEPQHVLQSTMLKIPFYDEITCTKISVKKIILQLAGHYAKGLPNNRQNLAFRAAELFFATVGFSAGVEIHVVKSIPTFSGLGGGSSDAAAALHALSQLFPEKAACISPSKWQEIHMAIGSDVPFFCTPADHAHVAHFGEEVTPLPTYFPKQEKHLVVAMLPRILCSSAWAYRELDAFFAKGKMIATNKVSNSFEIPVFQHFPDLRELRDNFLQIGAIKSGLTGSGSAIFAFFSTRELREKARTEMAERCSFWQECSWK